MEEYNKEEIYSFFSHSETWDLNMYGDDIKLSYLKRAKDFLLQEGNYANSGIVKKEMDVIREDSRLLLSIDPAHSLSGLKPYLEKQKYNLAVIKNILGAQDIRYYIIVEFVVKVAMFDIDEAYFLDDYWASRTRTIDVSKYTNVLEYRTWEAVQITDKFDMLLSFKDDYIVKRDEYEKKCRLKSVDVRSPQQKRKDSRSNTFDEMGGCIFLFVFFLFCLLIGAIIK